MRKNYWAAIGICFILAFLGIQYADSVGIIHQTSDNVDNYTIIRKAIEEKDEIFLKSIDITDYKESLNDKLSNTQKIAADTLSVYTSHFNWILKIFSGGFFWLAAIVTILFIIFIGLPVSVGSKRFFIKNQKEKVSILELLTIFKEKGYLNAVFVMLVKEISIFLWSILLIVPGIIKSYEYYMIPYIIADNPNIKRKRRRILVISV